jgi:hypothetical protein
VLVAVIGLRIEGVDFDEQPEKQKEGDSYLKVLRLPPSKKIEKRGEGVVILCKNPNFGVMGWV